MMLLPASLLSFAVAGANLSELESSQAALRRIPEHIALKPLLVAEKCAGNCKIEASRSHQGDCFSFVSNVLAVGDSVIGTVGLAKTALEVLHPQTAYTGLVIADDNHLKGAALIGGKRGKHLLEGLVQGLHLPDYRDIRRPEDSRPALAREVVAASGGNASVSERALSKVSASLQQWNELTSQRFIVSPVGP